MVIQLTWLATGFATGLPVGLQHDPGTNWMIWEITMVPKSAVLHYQPRKELWWLYCLLFSRTACPTHQDGKKMVQITTYIIYTYLNPPRVWNLCPLTTKNRPGGWNWIPLEGLGIYYYTFKAYAKDTPRLASPSAFWQTPFAPSKPWRISRTEYDLKSKQTNAFNQEGRMESHHETYKHFQSSIHDGRSYCTEHGHHTCAQKKAIDPSIKCHKNFHRPSPSIPY